MNARYAWEEREREKETKRISKMNFTVFKGFFLQCRATTLVKYSRLTHFMEQISAETTIGAAKKQPIEFWQDILLFLGGGGGGEGRDFSSVILKTELIQYKEY